MKIGLITAWDKHMQAVADIVVPNFAEYCNHHGYTLVAKSDWPDPPQIMPHFLKWHLAQEQLGSFDWIAVVDTDIFIMNMSVKLESFLTDADLVVPTDHFGLNSCFCFFRNTPWSASVLADILQNGPNCCLCPNCRHNGICEDQTRLAYLLYLSPKDKWDVIIPQRRINSYLYEEYGAKGEHPGQYQRGDFLIHLAGLPNEQRRRILNGLVSQRASP